MKLSNIRFFSVLLVSITLAACGGSSGGSDDSAGGQQPSQTQVKSSDLVAEQNFSFRVDQEITLVIQPGEGVTGVAHIYSETDSTSPADNQRPNYLSRITSIRPDLSANATFNYTGTEGILWVEWLPTATASQESLHKISVTTDIDTYYVGIQ